MTIRKILLDIDGVCNRLIMHALEVNGCPVSRFHDRQWPTPGSYDIVAAANKLLRLRTPMTEAEFWGSVTREVWAGTPRSGEFTYLLAACIDLVGRNNICFLTGPIIGDANCAAGKVEWIQRYAPHFMQRQFLIGPTKHFCAAPDHLLIDDSDANVNEFRRHGGRTLLVPRPWNSAHNLDSEVVLLDFFAGFQVSAVRNLQSLGLIPRFT